MSLYTENEEKWKQLIDIDYFTHFVKAWVTFNAWYKNHFPDADTDRAAINEIKKNGNRIKTRFLSLINGTNEESELFKTYLAQLHYLLSNQAIENNDTRIWFESFVVELDRNCLVQNNTYNGISYHVSITLSRSEITGILATVTNSTGQNLMVYNHTEYDLEHFVQTTGYRRLSKTQKNYIRACFTAANPKKPTNFLTMDESNCIHIGAFKFINNDTLIFKGLIEILYNLRNVLFHGQIVPDKQTNKVYEPAYKVLKMLLD